MGFFSYTTTTQGQKGILYAFCGIAEDSMAWSGTNYYAGVGVNVYDIVGVEVQLETYGICCQISIFNCSISADVNLQGATSLAISKDIDLGNGVTQTVEFSIRINTGLLASAVIGSYLFITTGNSSILQEAFSK